MKRDLKLLLGTSSLLLIVLLTCSCGEKNIAEKDLANAEETQPVAFNIEEIVVGNWQMKDFNIIDPNVGSMALDYARNIAPTVKYVFKDDGEYQVTSKNIPEPKKGIWKKGPKNNQLIIQIGNEPKMLIDLDKHEPNHLWCRTQTPRMGDITFQLIRIEE